eukprot:UN00431
MIFGKMSNYDVSAKARGLYRIHSTINHSCEPNCKVISSSKHTGVAIEALRNVEAKEEITISYIDVNMENRRGYR